MTTRRKNNDSGAKRSFEATLWTALGKMRDRMEPLKLLLSNLRISVVQWARINVKVLPQDEIAPAVGSVVNPRRIRLSIQASFKGMAPLW